VGRGAAAARGLTLVFDLYATMATSKTTGHAAARSTISLSPQQKALLVAWLH